MAKRRNRRTRVDRKTRTEFADAVGRVIDSREQAALVDQPLPAFFPGPGKGNDTAHYTSLLPPVTQSQVGAAIAARGEGATSLGDAVERFRSASRSIEDLSADQIEEYIGGERADAFRAIQEEMKSAAPEAFMDVRARGLDILMDAYDEATRHAELNRVKRNMVEAEIERLEQELVGGFRISRRASELDVLLRLGLR